MCRMLICECAHGVKSEISLDTRDEHGSALKPIFDGSGLDGTTIFLKIGGSGLDRTEKIFVLFMGIFQLHQNMVLG